MNIHCRSNKGDRRGAAMRDVFLRALEGRVARDPCGRVVLLVGPVDVTELAQVIRALKLARQQKAAARQQRGKR